MNTVCQLTLLLQFGLIHSAWISPFGMESVFMRFQYSTGQVELKLEDLEDTWCFKEIQTYQLPYRSITYCLEIPKIANEMTIRNITKEQELARNWKRTDQNEETFAVSFFVYLEAKLSDLPYFCLVRISLRWFFGNG